MLEKITEDKNKNELYNSSNNILLLNHYNLSKMRRNSTSLVLEKIPNEYSKKYFPSNNKPRKSDTSKHLSNNLVLRTPKKPKKSQFHKEENINNNNIENFLDKVYQNEKHLKKNILKKKNNDYSKKHGLKVSFMNFTPKSKVLKFNSKKITFSNYINENSDEKFDKIKDNNQHESANEEEDGQTYGYNKKYSLKVIDENEQKENKSFNDEISGKSSKNSLNKYKFKEINFEGDITNKTFNTANLNVSENHKIKVTNLKIKKSKSKPNFKKLKKKALKSAKKQEKKKKNNNVVNINYNINLNNKNGNKKNFLIYNKKLNKTEKENSEYAKNYETSKQNIISRHKESDISKNNPMKKNTNKHIYILNCCFPFLPCLRGNNNIENF